MVAVVVVVVVVVVAAVKVVVVALFCSESSLFKDCQIVKFIDAESLEIYITS